MIKGTIVLAILLSVAAIPVVAATWYPSEAEFDSWVEDLDYQVNGGQISAIDSSGPGIYVSAAQVPVSGGWWAAGVGLEYLYPNGLNLTGYDYFGLKVTNNSNTSYMYANLHLNTGWVPTPGDNHYQNGENWLAPGETKLILLDLSGVENLDQGTRTTLQLAGYSSDPGWCFENTGDAVSDCAHATITPEPMTICLLGLGAMMALRKKRN